MTHNFIWASNGVENIPTQLLVGLELDDHAINVWKQDPNQDEVMMGNVPFNKEFDWAQVNNEWFNTSLKTEGSSTFLYVKVINPSITEVDEDEDLMQLTHLQIIKDTSEHMYLYLYVHKDIVDPKLMEFRFMNRHPKEYQEMKDREYQEQKAAEEAATATEPQAE